MKVSRYNWVVKSEDKVIIYNGFTGCIAELLSEGLSEYLDILSCPTETKICVEEYDENALNALRSQGFLIDDEVDERRLLDILYNWQRCNSEHAAITLVMTGRCNFACDYCTQDHQLHSDMREDVIQAVLDWERRIKPKQLSIALYGGEPLLVFDSCLSFLDRLLDQRGDKGGFTVDLVSNGYLLSRKAAQELSSRNVDSVQITIDGNRSQHDQRRTLIDGSPTFDRILQNAMDASEFMYVNIRVNADWTVHESNECLEWYDALFATNEKVRIYVSPTRLCSQRDSLRNLNHVKNQFSSLFFSRKSTAVRIPGCGATSLSSMVVLPDGSIKACWEEVGTQSTDYGNILNPLSISFLSRYQWFTFDPTRTQPCSECRYLPTCAGGCPREMLINNRPSCLFKSDAEYSSFILENYITRNARRGDSI